MHQAGVTFSHKDGRNQDQWDYRNQLNLQLYCQSEEVGGVRNPEMHKSKTKNRGLIDK